MNIYVSRDFINYYVCGDLNVCSSIFVDTLGPTVFKPVKSDVNGNIEVTAKMSEIRFLSSV